MQNICEALEARTFLTGVTVITHGYMPEADLGGSVARPGWLDAMKDAIVARAGPGTAVFALRINRNGTTPFVESFTQLAGAAGGVAGGGANADTVVMLDWASASGVLSKFISVESIASLVVPYLESAATAGLGRPLLELPVHLIGHSRGASLVSALAADLGASGIWVDEMTTLDPVPVRTDPAVQAYSNVLFEDNYFQTADAAKGSAVVGGHNVDLTEFYTVQDALRYHDDMHTYYHGTIDTQTSGSGDAGTVKSVWYSTAATGPRDQIGFYYSALAGGVRPADGVGTPFGGAGARASVAGSGNYWPNIGEIAITGGSVSVVAGQSVTGSFAAQDLGAPATVTWMLDPDTNPYNGNEIAMAGAVVVSPSSSAQLGLGMAVSTAAVPSGTYHLVGKIADAGHVRFDEAAGTVTVTADPRIPIFVEHVYEDVLRRAADQEGLSTWTMQMETGAVTQQEVATTFLNCTEYRTILIQDTYSSALGRTADAEGLQNWLNFMAAGGTYETMRSMFYGSDEYYHLNGGTPETLVDSYYVAFLGRNADPDGLAYWVGLLNAGAERSDVALAISASSPEGAGEVVTGAYHTYLHREPDAGGYSYWVGQIQQGESMVDMGESFVGSEEYFARPR